MNRSLVPTFVCMAGLLFLGGCVSGLSPTTQGSGGSLPLPEEPESLLNVTWEWVATVNPVERLTVQDPSRYTILFQDDRNASVKFDCNRGRGAYELSEGMLSFGPLISTRAACPEDSQDALFMRDLQRVTSYFLREGELFLELPMDSGTMRFRQAQQETEGI